MSVKPDFKVIEKLVEIDREIKDLYEKRRQLREALISKYGVNEYVYEAPENEEGHKFVRMSIKDNLELFQTGEPLYRVAAFERFEVEVKFLKREPKQTLND